MPENVVLLHGFGGTHRAWDGVDRSARPRTLSPAGARPPWARRGRAQRAPDHVRRVRRSGARCRARALRARRLLARRTRRPARRARGARAGRAPRARGVQPRHRGSRRARRAACVRRGARRAIWNGSRSRSSSSAGARSRCSPPSRPRSARSRARTSAATNRDALAAVHARARHGRDAAPVGQARRAAQCP